MSQHTQLKQIAKRGAGTQPAPLTNQGPVPQGVIQHQPITVGLTLIGSSSVEQRLLNNVNTSIIQITAASTGSIAHQQASTVTNNGQGALPQSTAQLNSTVTNSGGQLRSSNLTTQATTSANPSANLKVNSILHQHSISKDFTNSIQTSSGQAQPKKQDLSAQKALQKNKQYVQSVAKTPQIGTLNYQNADYYSVQSNGSSRNMSTSQVQTASVIKKQQTNNLQHSQTQSMSAIRHSIASRNAAIPNYTMIKSSNIVVSSPGTNSKVLQNSESRQLHYKNQIYANFVGGSNSPNYKEQRSSIPNHGSQIGLRGEDSRQIFKDPNNIMTLIPVQMHSNDLKQSRGSIDKNFQRQKATSQERQRQRSIEQIGLQSNQRLNLAYQASRSYHLGASALNRRTSTIGVSPLALCSQHQKPVLSPNKSILSQQQQVSQQKNKNNPQNLEKQENNGPFNKEVSNDAQNAIQSKSVVVMMAGAQETPTSSIIQYSPKHPGGTVQFGTSMNTIFKSPQGSKKSIHPPLSSVLSSNGGSPQPPLNRNPQQSKGITQRLSGVPINDPTLSHHKKSNRGMTAALSYQQTSRIVHSKIVKNLNNNSQYQGGSNNGSTQAALVLSGSSPENCLKIDLNKIGKNSSLISQTHDYIAEGEGDAAPFKLYGGSAEIVELDSVSQKKKGPNALNANFPMQMGSPRAHQHATMTLNQQFFAKSPKMSTQKLTQQPQSSSNRHSLLLTTSSVNQLQTPQQNATQSNPTTQRQNTHQTIQQSSTFSQQTKSSIAKKSQLQNSQLTAVPQKVAHETQQAIQKQSTLNSKTQRLLNPSKNTYQKTYLVSKVPSKFETSHKKDANSKNNQVVKQIFEIVPPPQVLKEESKVEDVEKKNNEIIHFEIIQTAIVELKSSPKQEELVPNQPKVIQVDATQLLIDDNATTPVKISNGSAQSVEPLQNGEQDISPPKEGPFFPSNTKRPLDETAYFTPPTSQKIVAEQPIVYPMPLITFLSIYKEKMSSDILEELSSYPIVYYPGNCQDPSFLNPEKVQQQEAEPKIDGLQTPIQTKEEFKNKKSPFDDEEGYYIVKEGEQLLYRFEIIRVLGKGSFAQVVQCRDHKFLSERGEERMVAIKITRNTELDHKFAQGEVKLLQYLMQNDPNDEFNIVRLYDSFVFRDHHCFVFELLPKGDLFEHLKATGFTGFPLPIIKSYTREILKALCFLERNKIIHCDLKPENILLIQTGDDSAKSQPRLKLVDFGSGSFRGEQVYTYVQSRFYRAPEVIMRLMPPPTSYTEKVDIWSLGCILVELLTGEPLFPGNNEQEQLELIMELCGIPNSDFIDRCRKKEHYFDTDYSPFLIEDEEQGILRIPESKTFEQVLPTDDQQFIDFVKKCLELDPEQRFPASQAILHPWLKNIDEIGVKADWAQLSDLGEVSQDGDIYHQGRGLTAPDDFDGDLSGGNLTRQEMMRGGSDHQLLLIQENTEHFQQNHLASVSSSQLAFMNATNSLRRRDEDLESGVRGTQFEESPVRDPALEKPKKTLAQHFGIKPIPNGQEEFSIAEIENKRRQVLIELTPCKLREEESEQQKNDSQISTPTNEGGIINSKQKTIDQLEEAKVQYNYYLQVENEESTSALNISHEKRRDRSTRKKEHEQQSSTTPNKMAPVISQPSPEMKKEPDLSKGDPKSMKMIGHYEIFGRETNLVRDSLTSGIASEEIVPPINLRLDTQLQTQPRADTKLKDTNESVHTSIQSSGGIQSENQINKITITFYQKRGAETNNTQQSNTKISTTGQQQPKKK